MSNKMCFIWDCGRWNLRGFHQSKLSQNSKSNIKVQTTLIQGNKREKSCRNPNKLKKEVLVMQTDCLKTHVYVSLYFFIRSSTSTEMKSKHVSVFL